MLPWTRDLLLAFCWQHPASKKKPNHDTAQFFFPKHDTFFLLFVFVASCSLRVCRFVVFLARVSQLPLLRSSSTCLFHRQHTSRTRRLLSTGFNRTTVDSSPLLRIFSPFMATARAPGAQLKYCHGRVVNKRLLIVVRGHLARNLPKYPMRAAAYTTAALLSATTSDGASSEDNLNKKSCCP